MQFQAVYYEPESLYRPLGQALAEKFSALPWFPIESHNRIPEMQARENREFPAMKRCLIIGLRKTHRYVENHKISDYLVPFTSSGCTAMCLYCYLVCNYNKCAYLRLFVNREEMLSRLLRASNASSCPLTFELGSNSDLVLENTITGNLEWLIPAFAREGKGQITFPTKFSQVTPLLSLDHQGKTLFRMSVNPDSIIRRIELGTAPLASRIDALNRMAQAGYPVGLLIAPVILVENWQEQYAGLFDRLRAELSPQVQKQLSVEIIFMTYSYIHRAINHDAFPNALELYDRASMTGRGRGKYCYRLDSRAPAEAFLKERLQSKLPSARLVYIS